MNVSNETRKSSSHDWLLDLMVVLVLLALSGLLLTFNIDTSIFSALNGIFAYLPDSFWIFVTNGGDAAVALSLLVGLSRHRASKTVVYSILLTGIALMVVVQGLKYGLGIERPPQVLAIDTFHVIGNAIHSKSMPSGHTATAFCVAGILATQYQIKRLKLLLIGIAALVGLSRIAVGAHWPADVAVGAFIGWTFGYYLFALVERTVTDKRVYIWIGFVFSALLLIMMFFGDIGAEAVFSELLIHRLALVAIAFGTAIQFMRLDFSKFRGNSTYSIKPEVPK